MSSSDESYKRGKDLVLPPNTYAFVLDQASGAVKMLTGPKKVSLEQTDTPVVWDTSTKDFSPCTIEEAKRTNITAPEGWYVILTNPADKHPEPGSMLDKLPDLHIGKKINIPGPRSFALWPGQMAKVLQGHSLRSNQYLKCEVYNVEEAKKNWSNVILEPQSEVPVSEGSEEVIEVEKASKKNEAVSKPETVLDVNPDEFTMGQVLIIKGTAVSFFIPPTGIKVQEDRIRKAESRQIKGDYVRAAITLERLEYAILKDEDGNKRYVYGPAVVFPKPTEEWVDKDGHRKFRASELSDISGIHVKVIADYVDDVIYPGDTPDKEGKVHRKAGDELFITGKEQPIVFPREEWAFVRYGESSSPIIYAIAIPEGEARYVLDRLSGKVTQIKGPKMFLPDPRTQVVVRRILEDDQVALWFPNNQKALEINRTFASLAQKASGSKKKLRKNLISASLTDDFLGGGSDTKAMYSSESLLLDSDAETFDMSDDLVGDEFSRQRTFTQPRTVTLDTKYDGTVVVDVWNGYAISVTNKKGERKVIVGPASYSLEYDETLQVFGLSQGTPKHESGMKDVYLRVKNNRVSDVIEVETSDLVNAKVTLSYRVNFEGDSDKWFDVDNYVQFLCDHLRSLVRNRIKSVGIEDFYGNSINIIRDTILGEIPTDDKVEAKRPGRKFEENGMLVYDVEVLDVEIVDNKISETLVNAQRKNFDKTLELQDQRRSLDLETEIEEIKQKRAAVSAATTLAQLVLDAKEDKKRHENQLVSISADIAEAAERAKIRFEENQGRLLVEEAKLEFEKKEDEHRLSVSSRELEQQKEALAAEADALVKKVESMKGDIAAAINQLGDRELLGKIAESTAPLAIFRKAGIGDIFSELLSGTSPRLKEMVQTVSGHHGGNGKDKSWGDEDSLAD